MVRLKHAATRCPSASAGGLYAVLGVCLMLVTGAAPADEPAAAVEEEKPAVAETPAAAESPGQAELDKAIDAKLGANDLDDYERVLEHCKKAIELGLDVDSKKFADDLYTGTLVDRAGMIVDAIYDAVPPNPQWPRMRAFGLRDLGEVVERDPKLGQAHLMIARLESLPRGDRGRAKEAAEKALELLGDDRLQMAKAHIVLAGLEEDDAAKQEEHYAKAIEFAPRDVEIRRTRGLHFLIEDKFDRAREDLLVAIEEKPSDGSLHEALGMACMMGDKREEAKKAFDRRSSWSPIRAARCCSGPGSWRWRKSIPRRSRMSTVRSSWSRAILRPSCSGPASTNRRVSPTRRWTTSSRCSPTIPTTRSRWSCGA